MNAIDDAVKKLLVECQLLDVVVRRFSAGLRGQDGEPPQELTDGEASFDLGMGYDVGESHVDYSFTVKIESKTVEAAAEVVARYQFDVTELSEDVAVGFANRVAFFAAYPYLREVIQTSTGRLPGTQSFVLPIVQDAPGFVRSEE